MEAVAVPSVPPSVDVTLPVVLVSKPVATPVTFTVMVQVPLIGITPPARITEPVPAVAVTVPPQVLTKPLGLATSKPAGRLSVTATPDRAVVAFGLVMVMVKVVTPFSGITATPNALLIVGGMATITVAVAGFKLWGASVVVRRELVFTFTPTVVPRITYVRVQVPFAGMVPPVTVTLLAFSDPARKQEFTMAPAGKLRPVGRMSENATPVTGIALGLVNVKVSVVVAPRGKAGAPNAFVIAGGKATINALAEEVLLFPFRSGVPAQATGGKLAGMKTPPCGQRPELMSVCAVTVPRTLARMKNVSVPDD